MMNILITFLGILLSTLLSVDKSTASYWEWKSDYLKAEGLFMDGRYPEAFGVARLSLVASLDRHGKQTPNSVTTMELMSRLAQATGNFPQAVKFQSRAYDLSRQIKGPADPSTIRTLTRLAEMSLLAGNQKAGEACYREALSMCDNGNRSDCIISADPEIGLAKLLADNGNFAEAENLYRKAIAKFCCFSKYRPDLKLKMADALENLGEVCKSGGNYPEAANCFVKAQRIYLSQQTTPKEKLAKTLLALGDTYARWGKPERSIKSYKEVVAVLESQEGSPVSLGLAFKGLGDEFRRKGNLQMASNYYKRAINQFGNVSFVGKPLFVGTVNSLAEVYRGLGMDSEARLLETKIVAMK